MGIKERNHADKPSLPREKETNMAGEYHEKQKHI
jgi:hypothetical protein